MSTMKKILSLTLALAMLMSVSVFAGFADAAEIDKDATEAVNLLAAVNILNGIPQEDGTTDFAPAATIKRAEAAKMIYVLRNGGKDDGATTWKGVVTFADCKDHWAAGYIAYCEAYGLINGRTETVFDPEAPVTGIELAKMLLTTAGYKTEAEGFTGAGWEKNVVAEANAVELFKGVKFAISDAAPRQWAAVMFKNAFTVNVPTYIGDYRVDGILTGVTSQSVQAKFLNLTEETDVVVATKTATLTGTYASAAGKTVLETAGEVSFAVADALVGQQVKIAKSGTTILGIVATGKSVVGELKVAAKLTTGTDKDKYPVSIGTVAIGNKAADFEIEGATVKEIYDYMTAKRSSLAVTAYDVDGNKTIDYVATVDTTYGVVGAKSTATDTKGDFTVGSLTVDVSDTAKFTVVGDPKTGTVAKYTVDSLTGKVVVAPADVVVGAFTGISGTKYTVGGAQYEYGADALETAYLADYNNLKNTVVLYTDGKYVIKAEKYVADSGTTTPTTPTELPANLMYVIDGAKVEIPGTNVDEWGNITPAATKYAYKVKVMLANGAIAMFELETDANALKNKTYWSTANLFFDTGAFDTTFAGVVYEYELSTNGKLILKKGFADVDKVDFYVNGDKAQTVEANKAMGLVKKYNTTNTLFGDTFIMGTENTLVFAKYTNDKGEVSYKVIKLADLKGTNYTTKVLAATDAAIGEALLVVADYSYLAPTTTVVTTTPYILATSAPEYVVEGDKIYKTFTAIDLNNAGAAITYKAKADANITIAKGTIYKLTTEDGLVKTAEAETWAAGSVQAKVADLLLVKYAGADAASLVEIKGDAAKTYFATGCKIILKNGDTYTQGTVDNLIVAKKTDGAFNNNISYKLDGAKFAYIIIDLAK